MKKRLSGLLAFALCVSLFSGCGQKSNSGEVVTDTGETIAIGDTGGLKLPLSKKGETISWIVASSAENLNDKFVLQKLRQITGLNVQLQVYPSSTVKDKVSTLIASKNLPDIVGSGITDPEAKDLGMQGAFAAASDNLDLMPNFKSIFVDNEENSWIFKSYTAADGKLYGVNGYDWQRDVNHGVLYRKDIFDQHGLSMWNSPETFYQTLKKLKEFYPASAPFTSKNLDTIFNKLSVSWGINAQLPYYNEAEGVWKYSDIDPAYRDMLDYMKKLYDEKLLDPEFLTLTQAQWSSKMTQKNVSFVTWDWIGRLDMFKAQTADTVPEYDLRYGNPIGPKQTILTTSKVSWAKYVSANSNQKLSFQLLDFLLSPAGAELITMGVKGQTYELDENGMASYIGFPKDQKLEITDLEEKYGMYIEGMYSRFDRRCSYYKFSEREQEAQEYAKNSKNMEPADPTLAFTDEETKTVNDNLNNLTTKAKEFSAQYILTNKSGDEAWNAWLADADRLGAGKIVDAYNQAQQRYNSK